ncbi:hypothetical protein CN922_18455 [Bacillus cereus]|nr:hypothetical protein CN496_05370 [Bacillus cereus]PET77452.1 hypothetical protein CN528_22475 [Bacillus cereus]PGL50263.1 hypothetical protein CN922_18455 [Bacillus cereus]PGS57701.1 hypothetical protein COC66_10395 [Bacillus cereus]
MVVVFLFPEDNQDHHSLLYIFLPLFYMIFPYLSTSLIIGSIQFFLKFIYNELFPPIPIFRFHI